MGRRAFERLENPKGDALNLESNGRSHFMGNPKEITLSGEPKRRSHFIRRVEGLDLPLKRAGGDVVRDILRLDCLALSRGFNL